MKFSLGKLRIPADFERRLAAESFESLAMNGSHAREVATLPWHHRDPFDRMLIAQARVERMQLLTVDEGAALYGSHVWFAD